MMRIIAIIVIAVIVSGLFGVEEIVDALDFGAAPLVESLEKEPVYQPDNSDVAIAQRRARGESAGLNI